MKVVIGDALLPDRFVFRQTYFGDLPMFLADGEIRAKNHHTPQLCHQTSYKEIVDRRGTDAFELPLGGVVNDYVPFYFSPLTSFTFTINRGNVPLISPTGINLESANDNDRIFFVCRIDTFQDSGLTYCFSDYPLNSVVPPPTIETDLTKLETHIHWDVFDEDQTAKISEIGYNGVCKWFHNVALHPIRQLRSQKRMAEFLVAHAVPMSVVTCIITKSDTMRDRLQVMMEASKWNIPIYAKRGCYF